MLSERPTHEMRQSAATTSQPPLLLAVPEAARLLGVGVTLCWEMVHGGQLPSVRLGRRVLVPRTAIEEIAGAGHTSASDHDAPLWPLGPGNRDGRGD